MWFSQKAFSIDSNNYIKTSKIFTSRLFLDVADEVAVFSLSQNKTKTKILLHYMHNMLRRVTWRNVRMSVLSARLKEKSVDIHK